MNLRASIEYHVDKGISRRMLFEEVLTCDGVDVPCPKNPSKLEVITEFNRMVTTGILTVGSHEGELDHVVVTRWSPTTAAKMRGEHL